MQSDSSARGRLLPSKTSLPTLATGFGIAALGLAADQIAKLIVSHRFFPDQLILSGRHWSLVYVTNTGGICGYAQGANQLLTILGSVTTLLILFSLFFFRDSRAYGAAFGLLLAGAIGNLIDRIRLGHVIDFISLDVLGWPAFNVADTLIILGIAILGLLFLLETRQDRDRAPAQTRTSRSPVAIVVVLTGVAAVLGYIICVFRPFD
jgi:signal peptidase II